MSKNTKPARDTKIAKFMKNRKLYTIADVEIVTRFVKVDATSRREALSLARGLISEGLEDRTRRRPLVRRIASVRALTGAEKKEILALEGFD